MVSGGVQKRLNIERIAEIKAAVGVFMTLHGGSGTNDDDFKRAIKAGMTIVHVNTGIANGLAARHRGGLAAIRAK